MTGASAKAEQALAVPAEPASGLVPTGFDPSRIAEVVEQVRPSLLAPIIKKAADEFYHAVLETAEDYLRDNLEWNLKSHLAMLERENQRMRTELYEVDRKLGGSPLGHDNRIKSIRNLQDGSNGYYQLIWQVEKEYAGETRHETAMRYIKEREAASAMSAGTAETQSGSGLQPASAVPERQKPDV